MGSHCFQRSTKGSLGVFLQHQESAGCDHSSDSTASQAAQLSFPNRQKAPSSFSAVSQIPVHIHTSKHTLPQPMEEEQTCRCCLLQEVGAQAPLASSGWSCTPAAPDCRSRSPEPAGAVPKSSPSRDAPSKDCSDTPQLLS